MLCQAGLRPWAEGRRPEAALTVNAALRPDPPAQHAPGKGEGRYEALCRRSLPSHLLEGTLWLHERLGRFPGLADHLAEGLGQPLQPFSSARLWTGLEAQGLALRGTVGALSYLTSLAVPAQGDGGALTSLPRSGLRPP